MALLVDLLELTLRRGPLIVNVAVEAEGRRVGRRELDAIVGGELTPTIDRFAKQRTQLGGVGRRLTFDGELGIASDSQPQGAEMGLEDLHVIGGLGDIILVQRDGGSPGDKGVTPK